MKQVNRIKIVFVEKNKTVKLIEELDEIQCDIVGFNHKIEPLKLIERGGIRKTGGCV